jgi:hypothetical protein
MSLRSKALRLRIVLQYPSVGRTRYFDVAGFPRRTVGLFEERKTTSR